MTAETVNKNLFCEFRIRQIDSSFSFTQILCGAILTNLLRKEIRMKNEQTAPMHE